MYEPKVSLTASLQKYLREIEDVRDLLGKIPILPIVEERIQREALIETVHYTTRIEGNPLDLQAVARLGRLERPQIDRPYEQEVVNLYRVMEFIRDIAGKADVPVDETVIKQIHAYVVRDIPSQGPPGVYKTKPNEIINEATGKRIFLPALPSETPRLMSELSDWLAQSPLAFHPILAAALAHLELAAIHPFHDGNGRTARALADLILYRYGYGFRYLVSWVAQLGLHMDIYHQRLADVLGPEYGANLDPTSWLEYFAESVMKSLAERKPDLIRLHDTWVEAYNLGAETGLSRDQVEAMMYAIFYGEVTTGIYMKATKLSRATVVKRLTKLVEAGLMRIEGKGRNVRYRLSENLVPEGKE